MPDKDRAVDKCPYCRYEADVGETYCIKCGKKLDGSDRAGSKAVTGGVKALKITMKSDKADNVKLKPKEEKLVIRLNNTD